MSRRQTGWVCGLAFFLAMPCGVWAQTAADCDFDGNKEIGFGDYVEFVQAYGTGEAKYDLSGNGVVDFADFLVLAQFYGHTVPADGSTALDSLRVRLPVGSVDMWFVSIPSGTFMMGSPSSDVYGRDEEKPQHVARFEIGFYLGKYEVTQKQWEAVMGSNPSAFAGENRPVEQVSWNDAQEFVQRLNAATGDSLYRLPTEAEWEYACRAGTTTRWSFGDSDSELGDHAWYTDNSNDEVTADIGTRLANPWGLFDMYGNVMEWCLDWYSSTYYAVSFTTAPLGPDLGTNRVVRGAGYLNDWLSTRTAYRVGLSPDTRGSDVGFRLLKLAE